MAETPKKGNPTGRPWCGFDGRALGQTLVVTAGLGRVQRESGPIEDIRGRGPHRTGREALARGLPATSMTRIAIHEALGGTSADRLEHMSDGRYTG